MRVDGNRIRKEKVADSKISGSDTCGRGLRGTLMFLTCKQQKEKQQNEHLFSA